MTCAHGRLRALAVDGVCPVCPAPAPEVTTAQLRELAAEAEREHLRRNFAAFVRAAWPVLEPDPLQWSQILEDLCWHCQTVFERRDVGGPEFDAVRRLLINVPPRTLKTTIVSILLPCWVWLRWPAMRFLCVSGIPTVAIESGMRCLQVVQSEWYRAFGGPEIRTDLEAKSNFENTAGGKRLSVSIGSRVTGMGGDVIIVDDPHDAKEAMSAVKRASVNDAWKSTFVSRLNDRNKGIVIGVMQRLHCDDWAAHRIAEGFATFIVPMEFEPNGPSAVPNAFGWVDPRKEPGEILPRFNAATVEQLKFELGSFGAAGQLQQRPFPDGGGLIKSAWFGRYDELPPKYALVTSVDATFKGSDQSDYVVILTLAYAKAQRFVVDLVRKKMGFAETTNAIRDVVKRHNPRKILIEDKANGSAIIETLTKEFAGVIAVSPEGGKESRAHAVSPSIEAGQVFLPRNAVWLDAFLAEFDAFPSGSHDDQVDALTQALIYIKAHESIWLRAAA